MLVNLYVAKGFVSIPVICIVSGGEEVDQYSIYVPRGPACR